MQNATKPLELNVWIMVVVLYYYLADIDQHTDTKYLRVLQVKLYKISFYY